ncbi:MAG: hypothetical protein JKY44_01445 [Flavobacteriaceae bacterium]|nr:hypothetical protein [Flavobacteriaceae bacterium]
MKKQIKIIVALCFAFSAAISTAQNVKRYDGNIHIDAKTHVLTADFTITFNTLPEGKQMKLFLHESTSDLQLKSGSSVIKHTITNEEFIEKDHAINFDKANIKNLKLNIKYSLNLDSLSNNGFRFNENWIELNLYTAWYPFNTSYGRFPYTVTTKISQEYQLFGSGEVVNRKKTWIIEQQIPSIDISQVFYKGLREEVIGKIKLYHYNINSENVETIKRNTRSHFNLLNSWLGKSNSNDLVLGVSNLKHTTSYARKNFISLSVSSKYSEFYDKILAHELGHLWWNKASVTNWEEWLNESFAEYSAIILQRHLFGEENFEKNISRLKKSASKLASPYQLKKGVKNYQSSVTYKGAYFLYELENKIGRAPMFSLMTAIHKAKIKSTEKLLKLIEEKQGKEAATFLLERLKK